MPRHTVAWISLAFAVASCKSVRVDEPSEAAAARDEAGPTDLVDGPDAGADRAPPVEEAAATRIDVAFAGDVLPHTHVLDAPVAALLAGMPAFWATADARVFNLEAPIGERGGLEGGLALAAPAAWLGRVTEILHPSAFVAANNHSCDLGPDGQASTVAGAAALQVPLVGLATSDGSASRAWDATRIAEKSGRTVCLVAWTAFLNDSGENLSNPKARDCVKGQTRVAYAPLGEYGVRAVARILATPGKFDGCDARIAYVHAGNEYRAQLDLSLAQARAAAPYVDAVILSHPHVPDAVRRIPVGDRTVPVFGSLGNFVSNQGADWTPDKTAGIAFKNGQPDQARTAWTRVGMFARLGFSWAAGSSARDFTLRYGFALAFTERDGAALALRPLPSGPDDAVAARLRTGPMPFSGLLDDPCRISTSAPLPCSASQVPASQTTQGTTTSP